MAETIEIKYSCALCGLKRVSVSVPVRGEENVIEWMEKTGAFLGADHAERSPRCHPKELTEVMIPYTGRAKVGGPVVQ